MAKSKPVDFSSTFIPGRPPPVCMMIKEHMINKALNNNRRFDIFHPSAWGSCLRKIAYQFYNEKKPFLKRSPSDLDLRIERVFDNGHGMHFRWQEYLTNAKVLRGYWSCKTCQEMYGNKEKLGIFSPLQTDSSWKCKCGKNELEYHEVTVCSDSKYNFKGNVDAVIDLRGSEFEKGNDYDVYVVDFKSMKDSYFSELKQPKHEHVVQTHIYMYILDLKLAIVLYENKDNQQVKEMLVPRDERLIKKIKEEAIWLKKVLRNNKLPNRPDGFTRSKFPCRFCEFSKICFS